MYFKREDIEIMAPAGSYESLTAAIKAGAGSVYFGVEALNMRARSSANFTLADLDEIVARASGAGMKTYLTVNTDIYDTELDTMRRIVDRAAEKGVNAVIAADQAVIMHASRVGIPIHISTQLNVSNAETLRFYSQWADVVVLARELALPQVAHIHETIRREGITGPSGNPVRIEMFAHGALCMAVSGRCYLSLHESGNSANRGACRQICRRSYTLTDADTGEQISSEGRYLLSPQDLCTIGFLDHMLGSGVRVLKIEGRARSAEYVKRVVECYREAADAVCDGSYSPEKIAEWERRLAEVFNRGFWGGYYLGSPIPELSGAYGSSATTRKVYVGKVTNYFKTPGVAEVLIEASPLERHARVVVIGETTGALEFAADSIRVAERDTDVAPQGEYCSMKTPEPVRRGDKLYKIVPA